MAHEEEFLTKLRVGVFRVDSDGTIWRAMAISRTGAARKIEPVRAESDGVSGYKIVVLGKSRRIQAHRAAYVALVGPLAPDQELNHLNGSRADNRPENLEIATRSENIQHAYDVLGRPRQRGEQNGGSKLSVAQVEEIRSLQGSSSSRAVGARFGVSKTAILKIWNGDQWAGIPA